MKIEQYLRSKVSEHFIPLVKKDTCESCGEAEELEVHHLKQFIDMVYDSLKLLDIDYKPNKEDYTKIELEKLVDIILGIHLRNEYLTLCGKCHKDYHKKFGRKTKKKKYRTHLHEYTMEEISKLDLSESFGYLEEPPSYEVMCIKEHDGIEVGITGYMEVGYIGKSTDQTTFFVDWENGERREYNQKEENVLYKVTLLSLVY